MNAVLRQRTNIYLDWLDIFRVIMGRPIYSVVEIETTPSGWPVCTSCGVWVEPILPRSRRHWRETHGLPGDSLSKPEATP